MRILYIATSAYPGDNAYATRIHGICKSLQMAGNNTDVLTDYSNSELGTFSYEGSSVMVSAKHIYSERSLSDKVLAAARMKCRLHTILKHNHYDCIIMSSMYMRARSLMKLIRHFDIPIILESCEWFEAYNWKNGKKNYEYQRFVRAWNQDFIKVDGVIAISRMLEKHYLENIKHVVRIPTIMDIPAEYKNSSTGRPVRLIFTGSISWGKDRLFEAIKAVDELHNEGVNLELHIYGPTRDEIVNQLNGDEYLINRNPGIFIHGKVPHDEISARCSECDFGIILRPDRKQSNAGFPTKLAEYFAVGTSVIANDTGDIGLYIDNEKNGFLLPTDFTTEQLKELFKHLTTMDIDKIERIKKYAHTTAIDSFGCDKYSQTLNSFISSVIENVHN